MRKIFIKIPKNDKAKWSIQRKNVRAKRYHRAITTLKRTESILLGNEFKEKTAIVVKRYIDGKWDKENESLASRDTKYLLFTLTCFLDKYLSATWKNKLYKKYEMG